MENDRKEGIPSSPTHTDPGNKERPVSRRAVLAALGAAGVSLTAHAVLGGNRTYADNAQVSGHVYGGGGHGPGGNGHAGHKGHVDWHNVYEHGAKGDGLADDADAFQQLLNRAVADGAAVLYIPRGTYKLGRMLRIYRNTSLIVHPGAVLLRCHNDSFLLNGDGGAQYDGYEGHGNISIEGGIWDGNILQYPDAYNGFNFGHARGITVRDVTIKDVVWAHAIEINASRDVLIEHCRFLGFKNAEDGSRYYSEAIQIDVPTPLSFGGFGKYDGTPCRNITVRGCYFGASGTPGTTAWAGGVGTHGAIHDVWSGNIKILENTFEGLSYWAIRLFKWNDCLVDGNTILNCGGGITVSTPSPNSESTKDKNGVQRGTPQAGRGIRIVNNTVSGAEAYGGIVCYGHEQARVEEVSIVHNTVRDAGVNKHGIATSWCRLVRIEGNIVNNARRGIHLENTADAQVEGNRVGNITVNGIESAKCRNVTIVGNDVSVCGYYGISLSETSRFGIRRNTIEAAGRLEHNRYDGIIVSTANSDGAVVENRVRQADSGNQTRYGLQIVATSQHIETSGNRLEGVSGAYRNSSPTSGDMLLLYSPTGDSYKVTVDASGVLTATLQ
jgi:parallel beta-helix repeat protein